MFALHRPAPEPVAHGGSLAAARRLFPGAPEPFLDLSTGINPRAFPFPPLPADAFTQLPEPAEAERLLAAAAARYGAPSAAHVVAAPGTQILLPLVAGLVLPGRARVLAPTYAEHARAAVLAGHEVAEVSSAAELDGAGLSVVVNPNNPDGRVLPRAELLRLAAEAGQRGGLLVVDEAFMEVGPEAESLAPDADQPGLVVLRSFGKFHGLAGVRLGFALARPDTAGRLRALLGPWAVSGPALAVGLAAFADRAWAADARRWLEGQAARLDAVLERGGLRVVGGTPLFRLAESGAAVFATLGRRGILARRFADRPGLLRFGLPPDDAALSRLASALAAVRTNDGLR